MNEPILWLIMSVMIVPLTGGVMLLGGVLMIQSGRTKKPNLTPANSAKSQQARIPRRKFRRKRILDVVDHPTTLELPASRVFTGDRNDFGYAWVEDGNGRVMDARRRNLSDHWHALGLLVMELSTSEGVFTLDLTASDAVPDEVVTYVNNREYRKA